MTKEYTPKFPKSGDPDYGNCWRCGKFVQLRINVMDYAYDDNGLCPECAAEVCEKRKRAYDQFYGLQTGEG